MAFAQPWALLLGLLSIPIVLLYLLKQRRYRMLVPTLLFWDQVLRDEHTTVSLKKLRKLLSLLLQLLFLSLLVLALARPTFSKELLGARRVVILLDASASMTVREDDRETRFEKAKRKAREVVRAMAMGDTGMLVAVAQGADIVVPFTDSRKALLEGLDAIEITHSSTDFKPALDMLGHLPPDERPTCTYLITDGAAAPIKVDPPKNMRFAYLCIGEASENVGISTFALRPLPASPHDFEILLEICNETAQAQTIPFEVNINEGLVDAGELEIAAGAVEVHTLRQFSPEGGIVEVALNQSDPFPLDNRAYAVLRPPRIPRVLLVTSGNLFLESALITDNGIEAESTTPEEYAARAASGADYDVILFDRAAPEALPATNAIFIGAWPDALGLEAKGSIEKPLITDWDREHPVNRHLLLTNVAIEKAMVVQPGPGFETLVQSFDDPLVLLREEAGRQIMVVAFDPTASDLPLRVAFPILLANAIRHMTGQRAEQGWESVPVGALLTAKEIAAYLPEGSPEDDAGPLNLRAVVPPGSREAEPPEMVQVSRAGIYWGEVGEDLRLPLFAANLTDRRESQIAPSETIPVTAETPLAMVEEGARFGLVPWYLLTCLALALLVAEWVLFHRRLVE